jgi:branched-chain amino acid transport system permease protein
MNFWLTQVPLLAMYVVLAVSLDLLAGAAELLSIAQIAFMGVGGYTVGYLTVSLHWPFLLATLVGVLIAALAGAVSGIPGLRGRGFIYGVMSFAIAIVAYTAFDAPNVITNGAEGIAGVPLPSVGGLGLDGTWSFIAVYVPLAIVVVLLRWRIDRSPVNLALRAIRSDPMVGAISGIGSGRLLIKIMALSAGCAGLGGAMFAGLIGFVDPSSFSVDQGFLLLVMVIVGGKGNVWGAAFGAILIGSVPSLLTYVNLPSSVAGSIQQIIYALILIVVIRVRAAGIFPERPWLRRGREGATALAPARITSLSEAIAVPPLSAVPLDPVTPPPAHADTVVALECKGLRKSFGGVKAIRGVSIAFPAGKITGIIGANGAGKTTLIDLLSGVQSPDEGSVEFFGQDLGRSSAVTRRRKGMGRTFQATRLFHGLSAEENVMSGLGSMSRIGLFRDGLWRGGRQVPQLRGHAKVYLEEVQLRARPGMDALDLPYGEQKLVGLARALASDASVLLLDEPFAGVSADGVQVMSNILRDLARKGRTVILIDHNVEAVVGLVDYMVAVDFGAVIAHGDPKDVISDRLVMQSYLGTA